MLDPHFKTRSHKPIAQGTSPEALRKSLTHLATKGRAKNIKFYRLVRPRTSGCEDAGCPRVRAYLKS
jgi:hypothetical protein